MAAPSPRKPRKAKGRHRKPSTHSHWLAVGAVGVGLASAIVSGQGVAAADTGDSGTSQNDRVNRNNGADTRADRAERGAEKTARAAEKTDRAAERIERAAEKTDRAAERIERAAEKTERAVERLERRGRTIGAGGLHTPDETAGSGTNTGDVGQGGTGESGAGGEQQAPDNPTGQTPADQGTSPDPGNPGASDPSDDGETPVGAVDDGDPAGAVDDGDPAGAVDDDDDDGAISDQEQTPGGTGGDTSIDDLPPEQVEAARVMLTFVRELMGQLGLGCEGSTPTSPLGILLQAMWVSSRKYDDPWSIAFGTVGTVVETVVEATLVDLNRTVGIIPGVGTVMFGVSALYDAITLIGAVIRLDVEDITDELQDLARDVVGMIPIIGAKLVDGTFDSTASVGISALLGMSSSSSLPSNVSVVVVGEDGAVANRTVTAAATAEPIPGWDTAGWTWVVNRALSRLTGWGGAPQNFTDIAAPNPYQTDYTLDNLNNQLDGIINTAQPNSPARWLPDLLGLLGSFFASAVPGYTFTDTLNAWGDYLNRVAPPFKIADGAGTFDIISPYKIMGAAVVGTATVLKNFLNGVYDLQQIEIDLIKQTTGATVTVSDLNDFDSLLLKVGAAQAGALFGGDGGAFDDPTRARNVTLPTWTEAQTNPFTLAVYVGLVAVYKRFQEMSRFTTFTTWTTYDSWHYTNGLGMYAAGTFHAVDDLGRPIEFRADGTLGRTYTTEGNALVTINTVQGGFTYTPPALWDPKAQGAAFRHRSTAEDPEERFDWVTVQAYSADGVPYNIRVGVEIINGTNEAPVHTGTTNLGTDALGVYKGKINATDADGDPLRFYLVESSVTGLNGNTASTSGGGIVTLNETTGEFTYVSNATAGATQSFQVRINDKHHGNTIVTITVPNTTTITPANGNTSTLNTYTGTVPGSTNKPGVFVSYQLTGNPSYGTVTAFNPTTGTFTYVRNSGLGHEVPATDVVTVIATTADGRQVTLRMNVTPSVVNNAPVINSSTTNVGSSNSNDWGLNTSTWTQRTTGKITASDADGDNLTYTLVGGTTTNGGTVTFNSDGSYTYTITKNKDYFHNAAKIGASGSAVADTFTVAVTDGFGGVTYTTVNIAIYAVNSAPVISGYGNASCAFWLCTRGTMTVSDPDGDSIPNSSVTPGTGAGWTLSTGDVTVWGNGTTTISWGAGGTFGTQQSANTFTVYDGYWTVTNGIVNVGTPSKAWVQWHAGGGTSYGN